MADKITREQLDDLEYAATCDLDEYHRLLAEYANIEAVRYTGFSYYDAAGNYLGDRFNSSTLDLLEAAYVEVEDG